MASSRQFAALLGLMRPHYLRGQRTDFPVFLEGNYPYKLVADFDWPTGGHIPLRILLVDDHELVRRSVRLLLGKDSRWEVCGEAKNGYEGVDKALELTPDVVILDLSLPALGGLDVAAAIRQVAPSAKIIFFSIMDSPEAARIMAPGDSFVAKSSASTDLPLALEQLLKQRSAPPEA